MIKAEIVSEMIKSRSHTENIGTARERKEGVVVTGC